MASNTGNGGPDGQSIENHVNAEIDVIEKGLWSFVRPHIWKAIVAICISSCGTLSYFALKNSQNTSRIDSLGATIVAQQKTIDDHQRQFHALEIKMAVYDVELKHLRDLEDRLDRKVDQPGK